MSIVELATQVGRVSRDVDWPAGKEGIDRLATSLLIQVKTVDGITNHRRYGNTSLARLSRQLLVPFFIEEDLHPVV